MPLAPGELCVIRILRTKGIVTQKSEEFEKQVYRIHKLLESTGSTVTWDDKVPDPDNPSQNRQIDITLRNDDSLTIIECRSHAKKQDVKWIEELYGRKSSLNADTVIAVSSSGFTEGAFKKACRFGVILRDLNHLSDEEIIKWGRCITITLFFYQYSDIELSLFFERKTIHKLSEETLKKEIENYVGLRTIFLAPRKALDKLNLLDKKFQGKKIEFNIGFKIDDFKLQGQQVIEVNVEGLGWLVEKKIRFPEVLAYDYPLLKGLDRRTYIQKFDLGQTEIIHNNGKVSVLIDFSKLKIPPFCQFKSMKCSGNYENSWHKLGILGADKLLMAIDECTVKICAK